jgi:hypothetical protein
VAQDLLNLVGLLDGDAEPDGVNGRLDQDALGLISRNDDGMEDCFDSFSMVSMFPKGTASEVKPSLTQPQSRACCDARRLARRSSARSRPR